MSILPCRLSRETTCPVTEGCSCHPASLMLVICSAGHDKAAGLTTKMMQFVLFPFSDAEHEIMRLVGLLLTRGEMSADVVLLLKKVMKKMCKLRWASSQEFPTEMLLLVIH